VNIPVAQTAKYDIQRGDTVFRLKEDHTFAGFGLYLCPNLSCKEFFPEVISHIGPSKIRVLIGGKPVWDFPPGVLSMQPVGRLLPGKPAAIPPHGELIIEWQIIDNDVPPPVMFTVGFEGILTRDVI